MLERGRAGVVVAGAGDVGDSGLGYGRECGDEMLNYDDGRRRGMLLLLDDGDEQLFVAQQ